MQLALGEPPRANVGSFRLLFMIVRDDPPLLEGPFSTELKDFVWQCLRKVRTAKPSVGSHGVYEGFPSHLAQQTECQSEFCAPVTPLPQEPKERPSAMDLLQHPFVAMAEKPAELEQRIAAYLAARPALAKEGGTASPAEAATEALPKWDFGGTVAAGAAAGAAAAGAVAGAAAGLAAVAPATMATVAATSKPPRPSTTSGNLTGTVMSRPATAPDGGAAAAGVAAAAATDLMGTVKTVPVAAPVNGTNTRRHTENEMGGTVEIKKVPATAVAPAPAPVADSAATVASRGQQQQRRRIQIPNDPSVPDLASDGSQLGSTVVVPALAPAARQLPPPRAARIEPDSGPIRLLMQPALTSAAGGSARAVAAAETALAALAQLEVAQPGATRSAVTDMLALLSVSSAPALAPLKSSAAAVFGGEGGTGAVGQFSVGAADLGPLGNFLLARWREGVARERAASGGRAAEAWGLAPQ